MTQQESRANKDKGAEDMAAKQRTHRASDARKRLGDAGEQVAAEYLLERGYTILARNWRCRGGELDLVALDGSVLVFVEVRSRSTRTYGTAEESVDWRKQRQVRRVASFYLTGAEVYYRDLRFDVITVYFERASYRIRDLHHIKHAF